MTFKLLYCFFVIEQGRRKIRHFNVTQHPTAEWVVQQLREAFPEAGPLRYVILDRDAKFNADVLAFLRATGLKTKRTSIQSPWQNGIAERWVGGCRRELLDHVIPLNEEHLRRLVREYISYFHEDRIHDSLGKDTPNRRAIQNKLCPEATILSVPAWAVFIISTPGEKQRSGHAGSLRTPLCRRPRQVEATYHSNRRAVPQIRGRYCSSVPQLGETPTWSPSLFAPRSVTMSAQPLIWY